MQFAFDGPARNPHRLENHQRHSVVYMATHDSDTALGWWRALPERGRDGDRPRPASSRTGS